MPDIYQEIERIKKVAEKLTPSGKLKLLKILSEMTNIINNHIAKKISYDECIKSIRKLTKEE